MNSIDHIQIIYPSKSLKPFIQYYLFPAFSKELMEKESGGILQVFPSPSTSLVLFFNEPSLIKDNGKLKPYDEFVLTGYYSSPKSILRQSHLHQMIVRFTPTGIQQLIHFKLSEITDKFVSVRQVFPVDYDQLINELSPGSNEERVKYFERYYTSKLREKNAVDNRTQLLINYIEGHRGSQKVKEISMNLGIGERTIQRLIHKYIGLNYKSFSKLVRFRAASKLLHSYNATRVSDIAYELGYFDQAHFNHDFKDLAEITPVEYLHSISTNKLFNIPNKVG